MKRQRNFVILFFAFALVLGALQAWYWRGAMNPDGIAYLDEGSAVLRGDLSAALNGYRSPGYPLLLGTALRVFTPGIAQEFPLVHAVNFLIYILSLVCFQYFITGFIAAVGISRNESDSLVSTAWLCLGYSLFLWSSLAMISLGLVSPDLLVSAVVYLACGILVRIQRGRLDKRLAAGLGLALGIGYLIKPPLLLYTFVFVTLSCLLMRSGRRRAGMFAFISLSVVFVITGPFIAALSAHFGRLVWGGGALAQAFMVNGAPIIHWRGKPAGTGSPQHPTRLIWSSPAVYEFDNSDGSTFSPWYNPTYWNAGMSPDFRLNLSAAMVVRSFKTYVRDSAKWNWMLGIGILSMWALRPKERFPSLTSAAIFGVGAFGLLSYAPVWVDWRYVGAFVPLFWCGLFGLIRSRRQAFIMISVSCLLTVATLVFLYRDRPPVSDIAEQLTVASELKSRGLSEGTRVAFIGSGFYAYWARLARLKIVVEIPGNIWDFNIYQPKVTDAQLFWHLDQATRDRIIAEISGTRAKAILAKDAPSAGGGWTRIGDTRYSIFTISDVSRPQARLGMASPKGESWRLTRDTAHLNW